MAASGFGWMKGRKGTSMEKEHEELVEKHLGQEGLSDIFTFGIAWGWSKLCPIDNADMFVVFARIDPATQDNTLLDLRKVVSRLEIEEAICDMRKITEEGALREAFPHIRHIDSHTRLMRHIRDLEDGF